MSSDGTSTPPDKQPPLTSNALLVQDLEANCKKLIQEKIQEWQDGRPQQAKEELQKLLKEAEDDLDSTNGTSVTTITPGTDRKALLVQLRRTLNKLEEQESEGKEKLPQDTFSFFIVSPISKAFFYAMVPLVIQAFISILMLLDTLQTAEKKYNPWNLPVDVDLQVRLSQLVAILISAITQDDILIALTQLADCYTGNLANSFQRSSKPKWFFSLVCRWAVGCLVLFVSILLIAQQETVVGVFLNFLAVSFISEMDNIAFRLAINNFVGKLTYEVALEIESTSYAPQNDWEVNCICNNNRRRRLLIFVLSTLALAAWGRVVQQQASGDLLVREILVQFDDNFSPALGTFTGVYTIRKDFGRATYIEKRSGQAIFGYCDETTTWTFTIGGDLDSLDPCQGLAQSAETASYDITTTSESSWFTIDEDRGALPMQHFYMASYDCRDNDICGNHGKCSNDNGGCLCDKGWFGLRCEFPSPCPSIERDERRDGFLGSRIWSQEFEILQNGNKDEIAQIYGRPVYVQKSTADEVYDIILFTGRRWMMTHTGHMTDLLQDTVSSSSVLSLEQLSDYLVNEFHAYWSNYTVAFVSEPADIGTPGDSVTPISLQWFGNEVSITEQTSVAVADERQNQQVTLICQLCNNQTNSCFFRSLCRSNGVCECTTRATGKLCQVPPISNGRCDDFFNNPSFQYDGGDCCQATCQNTNQNTCGKDISRSGLVGYFGFEQCRDPSQICTSCWKAIISVPLRSAPTNEEVHSIFYNHHYMALSRNGKMLAVHAGLQSRGFQVYEIQSSKLAERGKLLSIPDVDFFYGDSVSLSDDGDKIAIGGSDTVQVYFWDNIIGWLPSGNKLPYNELDVDMDLGMQVKLSADGNTLAVVHTSPAAFIVYDRKFDTWVARGENGTVSTGGQTWYAISLSGDGRTIAVGIRAKTFEDDEGEAVRVFHWNDESWNQVGSNIQTNEALFGDFGGTVALSYDANIVAVGSPKESTASVWSGVVRVYEWEGSRWAQKGANIVGRRADLGFGSSLSLSDDGLIMAIGCNAEGSPFCEMRTLSWDENNEDWIFLGGEAPIPVGSSGVGVLSGDGSTLAVASIDKNQVDVIETNIFRFQLPPLQCEAGESLLRISLLPDNEGEETKWRLLDEFGNTAFEDGSGHLSGDSLPVVREWCIKSTSCLTLKLFDLGGDGMCCDRGQGSYIVWVDGLEVASGGEFRWYDEVRIGKCPYKCSNETSLVRLELKLDNFGSESTWELWNGTSGLALDPGRIYSNNDDSFIDVREFCVPKEECSTFVYKELCNDKNFFDAGISLKNPDCGLGFENPASGYRISLDGEEIGNSTGVRLSRNHSIGTCTPACEDGLSLLKFMLRTDRQGSDTTWSISSDGEVLREGGPYEYFLYTAVDEEFCIDMVNSCTTVAVYDASGDGMITQWAGVGGFFVEVDGDEIKFGGNFESADITQIGNCSPSIAPSSNPSVKPSQQPSVISASPSTSSPPCENAVEVFPGETVSGETSTSSFVDSGLGECGTPITSPGAWYQMQGTGGLVTISTCYAADFDTKISIFQGTCDSLECIAGEDDSVFCDRTTFAIFLSDSNSTYYIFIHGHETETGNFNMTVSGL